MIISCVIGAVLIGWAPIFVRWIDLGPSVTGFYRCLGGALVLLPWAFHKTPLWKVLRAPGSQSSAYLKYVVLAGVFFGLDLAAWHRSVHALGAGMATVLGNTQVFHVVWIGALFFRERIQGKFFVYLFVGFLGLILLVGERPESMNEIRHSSGVFFGVITGLFYAGFLTFLRQVEKLAQIRTGAALPIPAYANLGLILLFSALTLGLIATFNNEWQTPSLSDAFAILALVLVPQVLGWILITRSLSKIATSLAGLIILLQPLVASLLGAFLFEEEFSPIQIFGGLILLCAIYMGSLVRERSMSIE